MQGIVNIYKDEGYTSFDIVAIVRKTLAIKKIGHTGTLDPLAKGVLPICIGKATKVVDLITNNDKTYRAVVKLGITTDTGDRSGNIISKSDFIYDEENILRVVESFKGEYYQTPPMYSALKVDGKKLYQYAREGKTIERKKRKLYIYDININKFLPKDSFEIEVSCSKGTYIRTLCEDIGKKLNTDAFMYSLVRTRVGEFFIDDSITINDFKKYVDSGDIKNYIKPVENVFCDLNKIIVKKDANKYLLNGNKLYEFNINYYKNDLNIDEDVSVYDYNHNFIGIYTVKKEDELLLKPKKMFL